MFGRVIWDKLPECIFENFEIARVKRVGNCKSVSGQLQNSMSIRINRVISYVISYIQTFTPVSLSSQHFHADERLYIFALRASVLGLISSMTLDGRKDIHWNWNFGIGMLYFMVTKIIEKKSICIKCIIQVLAHVNRYV